MLKLSQRNKFRKLKGGREISILKIYSIKERGNVINIFRHGTRIRCFPNNVTTEEIERYITKYEVDMQEKKKKKKKFLKDYCGAPISICSQFENCKECKGNDKEWALERKKEGKKIVRPKPEDISDERTTLSPVKHKKIVFKRLHHGFRW